VQEETEEDLSAVMEKIAAEGDISFSREDVDTIHRNPSSKNDRPRNVVIQLKTSAKKNLLANKRNQWCHSGYD